MTRRRWALAAAGTVLAIAVGIAALPGSRRPALATDGPSVASAPVEFGSLSAVVSTGGTLTYRGRPDGSPYTVVNQTRGIYTALPNSGDKVACGAVLYRVDDRPVLLLCGHLPLYRELHTGMNGRDVSQLNRALRSRGGATFTADTASALRALQRRTGQPPSGRLGLGDAVFVPEAVRVARVAAVIGGPAQPGLPVISATSDRLVVQVNIDPSQQAGVMRGDAAQVALPGNVLVRGVVAGFGRVAQTPPGQNGQGADATIPTFISLRDPAKARGLDRAPVQVDITTHGVDRALSVPVTALVGRSGGGFGVELVRGGNQRQLIGVKLGLYDAAGGRVQVQGDVRKGDRVVVPST